jgi:hypothetical protein
MSRLRGLKYHPRAGGEPARRVYCMGGIGQSLFVRWRFSVVFIIHLLDFNLGLDQRSPEDAMCR